jgi:hypothetical protein
VVPIVTGLQKLDPVICRDRDEREVDTLYFIIKMSSSDSWSLPLDHKLCESFTELQGTVIISRFLIETERAVGLFAILIRRRGVRVGIGSHLVALMEPFSRKWTYPVC